MAAFSYSAINADGLELIVMQRTTRSTQEGERNADYQLAPVTSPLVGESLPSGPDPRVAIAKRWREGGIAAAQSNKHPPPYPSPTRPHKGGGNSLRLGA